MYVIEDVTDNMNESEWAGEWLSVAEGMRCYRVLHDGSIVLTIFDEYMKETSNSEIVKKAEEYLNEEVK